MLPFLIASYGLSYFAVSALAFANSVVSILVQPLFGYLGDKRNNPWLMSLGIMLAGMGIALMGIFTSYWLIFASALLMGTGVAIFHPEGGKLANVVAGKNKGTGISNFSVGGNIGFVFGPILVTAAHFLWGMHGTLIFLVPAIVAMCILLPQTAAYRRLSVQEAERIANSDTANQKDDWVGFTKVSFVNVCRAIIGNSLVTFIPLYWIAVLSQTAYTGTMMLSAYSVAMAFASFFGGRIAERLGLKRMVVLSIGVVGPMLILFVTMGHVMPATVFLILCSLSFGIGYAPVVALAQAYLPNRVSLASGISLGVVVSMGGIASMGLGAIGDVWGLRASMSVVCVIAFIGLAIAILLYRGRNAKESTGAPPSKHLNKSTIKT